MSTGTIYGNMTMQGLIIEDRRTDVPPYVDVDSCRIGEIVETTQGDVCVIAWADVGGRPYAANPGYPGLFSLRTAKAYTDRAKFPKVRKIQAKLVIGEDECGVLTARGDV